MSFTSHSYADDSNFTSSSSNQTLVSLVPCPSSLLSTWQGIGWLSLLSTSRNDPFSPPPGTFPATHSCLGGCPNCLFASSQPSQDSSHSGPYMSGTPSLLYSDPSGGAPRHQGRSPSSLDGLASTCCPHPLHNDDRPAGELLLADGLGSQHLQRLSQPKRVTSPRSQSFPGSPTSSD